MRVNITEYLFRKGGGLKSILFLVAELEVSHKSGRPTFQSPADPDSCTRLVVIGISNSLQDTTTLNANKYFQNA
jgi:hypothetical protein